MKKSNCLRCIVLIGILLFSCYFGFAQTAEIRIFPLSNNTDVDFYELQYRKANENESWQSVGTIVPEWEQDDNTANYCSYYYLEGLECDTMYNVRVRACKMGDDLEIHRGTWAYVQFRTPQPYTDAPWIWQIGPFDIICRTVIINTLSVMEPSLESFSSREVYGITKEAIKEE